VKTKISEVKKGVPPIMILDVGQAHQSVGYVQKGKFSINYPILVERLLDNNCGYY